MSSTSPVTTREGVKLPDGRVGNTYGPYGFRLGTGTEASFVPDADVSAATALSQAFDDGGKVVATLIANASPDAQGWWYFRTQELIAAAGATPFAPGNYAFDVVVTYANGVVQTPIAGTWAVGGRPRGAAS